MEQSQENRYRFLFPFERVPKGARIIIYGAGVLGQEYLHQMMMTHYCEVVAMADRNYAAYQNIAVPVISPTEIYAMDFDYVVIALRTRTHLKEFLDVLRSQGIPKDVIIDGDERQDHSIFLDVASTSENERPYAYQCSKQNLLVNFSGGFGDCVVYKKIMETFIRLAPKMCIDVFTSRGLDFLRFLYADTPQIQQIELNLGVRYRSQMRNYAAAISFYGHALHVDVLQYAEVFPRALTDVLRQLQQETSQENPSYKIPIYTSIYRTIFQGGTVYDRLSYHGIIPISDRHVHIPEDADARREMQDAHLGSFITLNFGNGIAGNAKAVAKSWTKERFEKVIQLLHEAYPDFRILQLGDAHASRLLGAYHGFLGTRWPLVAQILAHSKLHIDIEGGLVHLANQLGTKCLVLFGATAVEYYGYPENINLHVGTCHGCYGLYEDVNRCARDLDEPECMYSITPEMVMDAAREYLDGIAEQTKAVPQA